MKNNALAAIGTALPAVSPPDLAAALNKISSRRAFLRQLATLPLIGGAVTLIGQPSAVAEPVTATLLETYKTFLFFELRQVAWELADHPDMRWRIDGDRAERSRTLADMASHQNPAARFHRYDGSAPAGGRAALVLSAIGCDWRED